LGLRQSDVARRLGAYTSTVNTWENGHFTPDVRFVPGIVEFLGYDPFGPTPTSFPDRLKAARVAAGLTRRQLAARIGVHPGAVAEWERGKKRPGRRSAGRLNELLPGTMEG
jgi:transcriptional regulator with XRE-family HTH domain